MSLRIEKINQLIKELLGEIVSKNLSFKEGVFVTLTKVDTSSDLRYTRVFFSVFPESETGYVGKALKNGLYSIQGDLNRKLHMKPLPKLDFRLDDTEVKADEIERLLKGLR